MSAQPARSSSSSRSWRTARTPHERRPPSGATLSAKVRTESVYLPLHNRRIGGSWQRRVSVGLLLYTLGPFIKIMIHCFFRVETVNARVYERLHGQCIWAFRHFFEWDPFLIFYGGLFLPAFFRPRLLPYFIAGKFWMKSPLRRSLSWGLGLIGVEPRTGADQSGMRAAVSVLQKNGGIAIAPTGPRGHSTTYRLQPGVGRLSEIVPDAPVVPIALVGVRELRWVDVLTFRRPCVSIRFGEPRSALDLDAVAAAGGPLRTVFDWIELEWARLEGRHAARETETHFPFDDPSSARTALTAESLARPIG